MVTSNDRRTPPIFRSTRNLSRLVRDVAGLASMAFRLTIRCGCLALCRRHLPALAAEAVDIGGLR